MVFIRSTFLAIVHVYVVIHFVIYMCSFRVQANLCRLFFVLSYIICVLPLEIQLWRRQGWDITNWFQGRIQDLKLGGAHLKKLRRAEGGAKIVGVFRVKNHDFTPKNNIFSNFRGGGGGGAGCPPPWIRPWPRVFTNQWWRQIRRTFICHFAIWLVLPLHILHTVVPITVMLQSSTSWDLIDVCEWMSNLDSTFWDWEMKSISLQHFIWWSYRFSGAMLCCLVQAADNR